MSVLEELRSLVSTFAEVEAKNKTYSGTSNICMQRKESRPRPKDFMAYDLETTRIKAGETPTPLYLTAFSERQKISIPITGRNKWQTLCDILEAHLLIPENNGIRFIAWNGNTFDAYLIARALLLSKKWIMRPYLTRTKMLRGIKVIENREVKKGEKKLQFEFLDGMAMTGLYGFKLAKFLSLFAPDYKKLTLDFEKEEFDYKNPYHVEYAERDSEGLYYGIREANRIVRELTGNDLQPTIGNLAIKYLQSKIPYGVKCWRPPEGARDPLYTQLKRGGYCWVQQQYHGPIWKYDLNQAYAAAMRDAKLPAGKCARTDTYMENVTGIYHVKIFRPVESKIPFYYRSFNKNLGYFTSGAEVETWITSSEYDHLLADNWSIEVIDGWYWDETFNMAEMVNELERLRFTDPQGPSGPLGTMVKYIGNNAYGKTLEMLEGMELVFAQDCPEGFEHYLPEQDGMQNIFARFHDPLLRAYHQPQIGIFITAHVRLLVRDAALKEADTFLYADTDCVVFSKPVTHLDIDAKRYGAWKQEVDGKDYVIIGKKIYYDPAMLQSPDPEERMKAKKAKGLNIKELTYDDYQNWYAGKVPVQKQTQKQNFVKFIGGRNMFTEMERKGTDVTLSQQSKLVGNRFVPVIG